MCYQRKPFNKLIQVRTLKKTRPCRQRMKQSCLLSTNSFQFPAMRNLEKTLLIPAFFLLFNLHAHACVDSIWYKIDSVQCNGLRNGKIFIEKVFGGASPYYYSIDGQSFSTNPNFDHLWAGNYLLHVRDASGCILKIAVEVPQPDEIQVAILVGDTLISPGTPVFLRAIYAPETAIIQGIQWRPPDLFPKQDSLRQTVYIAEKTTFAVELLDNHGCVARNQVSVDVEKIKAYFPNVLKPGSAQNAWFTVFTGEGVQKVAILSIYSRVGAKVFEKVNFPPNDPLKGWNGYWNNQLAQPGVYLWIAEIELLDGTKQHFQGTVTVVY